MHGDEGEGRRILKRGQRAAGGPSPLLTRGRGSRGAHGGWGGGPERVGRSEGAGPAAGTHEPSLPCVTELSRLGLPPTCSRVDIKFLFP